MPDQIINKVAESGIITLDPAEFLPKEKILVFDLKDHLFMGLILKEKDFREALKQTDWSLFESKNVAITCSADVIIPVWAYMLVMTYLQPVAKEVIMGTAAEMHRYLVSKKIEAINSKDFADKRVVVKGCGDEKVDEFVYAEITKKLLPEVKSIMYGEPCSTVPLYKKRS